MNQSKLKVYYVRLTEHAANVCERVTIAFGFTSDWMRKLCEILKPIV